MKRHIIQELTSYGVEDGFSIYQTVVEIVQRAERIFEEKGFLDDKRCQIKRKLDGIMNEYELKGVDGTIPIVGANEVLYELKRRGLRIGVVTRSCREYALKTLKNHGLMRFVDAIVARDDSSRPKPDPQQVYYISKLLRVDLRELLMVGDHIIDAACAKEAGVKFIGVLSGSSKREALIGGNAVSVTDSVKELSKLIDRIDDLMQGSEKQPGQIQ